MALKKAKKRIFSRAFFVVLLAILLLVITSVTLNIKAERDHQRKMKVLENNFYKTLERME